jgi:hypothetical protein
MELTFNAEKHIYRLNGKRLTSVTTVLGAGVPKPMLIDWAGVEVAGWALDPANADEFDRLAHEHRLDLAAEAVDDKGRTAAQKVLGKKHHEKRDKAAVRGTAVHNLAEQLVHGEQVEVPEELAPYIDGYLRFLDTFEVAPLMTERTVLLAGLGVAGRFDLIATSPHLNHGEPFIADVKTSSGVYRETAAQLAAYGYGADGYVTDTDPHTLLELPYVTASFVLHCTPEGTHVVPFAETRDELGGDFDYFLSAHHIYERTLAKHKVKDPIPYPTTLAA